MRHTNFRATNSSFKVIGTSLNPIDVYEFTLTGGLITNQAQNPVQIGSYTIASIPTSADPSFSLIIQDGECGICRVGDPEVLLVAFTGTAGEIHSYAQYDLNGVGLDSGTMTEIGNGFYYVEPMFLIESFFDLSGMIKTLSVPYKVINCADYIPDAGIAGDQNFVNVGYNLFGFLGEQYSSFDLLSGQWVSDPGYTAKASDLAKAVCSKYNLVWGDTSDPLWIGNYVSYIRTYDENAKKFRLYKPFKTPDTNDANFALHTVDEAGSFWLRGVSLLLLQNLETIAGVDGATIKYKGLSNG